MSNVAVPAAPQSRSSNGAAAQTDRLGAKTGHQRINKVAVLGAGTMGARICRALGQCRCSLLTCSTSFRLTPTEHRQAARNKIAAAGLEAAVKSKPAAFYENVARLPGHHRQLRRRLMKLLAEVDWIIEAVVENLEIKRALLKKVEAVRKPGSDHHHQHQRPARRQNCRRLLRRFPPPLVRHALLQSAALHAAAGNHSHAGNRPRGDGDRSRISATCAWARACVTAKDTPNFIANRIGTFSMLNVMRLMQEMDLTIEEVDALTGTAVGWPKTATFRTIDLVGLDVLGHVVAQLQRERAGRAQRPDAARLLQADAGAQVAGRQDQGRLLQESQKGPQGEKSGSASTGRRSNTIPRRRPKFPALEMAKNIEDLGERLRTLLAGDPRKTRPAQFLWTALSDLWTYSANRIPEIADTVVEIDRAMRMGFNWEVGPFELWDAAGVEPTVARMKKEGKPVAPNVEKLLASGAKTWYEDDPPVAFRPRLLRSAHGRVQTCTGA